MDGLSDEPRQVGSQPKSNQAILRRMGLSQSVRGIGVGTQPNCSKRHCSKFTINAKKRVSHQVHREILKNWAVLQDENVLDLIEAFPAFGWVDDSWIHSDRRVEG